MTRKECEDTDQGPESRLQLFDALPGVQHRGAYGVAQVRHYALDTHKYTTAAKSGMMIIVAQVYIVPHWV